ncbi:hypothetical protein ACQPXS_02095 [Streptomyces sp. CA-142005]|uniref:hypothetical protein n=1 Tax=Streptomyces sp. CA-142005 TaxID=3240052 RepID=UPI003D92FB20
MAAQRRETNAPTAPPAGAAVVDTYVVAVLAMAHPDTGEPSYVAVELKRWSQAEPD